MIINLIQQYSDVLEDFDLEVVKRDIWASVFPAPQIDYSWKLHLSSIQSDADGLLKQVLPILKEKKIPFKIALNSDVLAMLNEGTYGATQVGKFMTIYPESNSECRKLSEKLVNLTEGFKGPAIVTDCHLGGAVYARYGIVNPVLTRDRLGNVNYSGTNPDGAYKVPFECPVGIENPFEDIINKENENLDNDGRLIGTNYMMVKVLNTHAKGSIFKALDFKDRDNVKYVVLKEGREYCVSDSYGRHIFDRLIHQKNIHNKLHGKIPIPEFIDLFNFAGNMYLVLSYIDGIDLEHLTPRPFGTLEIPEKKRRISILLKLSELIHRVHEQGIIHRDISPRNVRVSANNEEVFLIDYELCFDINTPSFIPFTQGTPGYLSPQQKNAEHPSFEDDIYSLGAIMLMTITGLDTQRVLFSYNSLDFDERICMLSGAPMDLCELIARCLATDSKKRPKISEIIRFLNHMHTSITSIKETKQISLRPKNALNENEIINSSLAWLLSDESQESTSGLWFSPEIESESHNNSVNKEPKFSLFRSTSRGVAGVLYTIGKLKKAGYYNDKLTPKIHNAVDWLLDHVPTPDDQMQGLHFGEAGVAVAISEILNSGIVDNGDWIAPYLKEALSGPIDWPDLTHGAAGQGIAALICTELNSDESLSVFSDKCADHLIKTQKLDGSWVLPEGVKGMENSTYTGFAHGVAGIIYFLCKYSKKYDSKDSFDAALKGGDWLIENARGLKSDSAVNWPLVEGGEESWKWWCHGGPGIALTLLSLFELTGNRTYLDLVSKCLKIHPKSICYNNFSQCHGLSGLGEIYLEAYKYTQDEEYYEKSEYIANILTALAKTTDNGTTWLVENPFKPTADLMIGSMGIAHFLARFFNIKKFDIGMPLMV